MSKQFSKIIPLFVVGALVAGATLFLSVNPVQAAAPDAYGPPADRPDTCNTCDPLYNGGNQQSGRRGNNPQGTGIQGSGQSLTPLSDVETADLISAIEEEYGAMSLYLHIEETLGESVPFASIASSEQQHLNTLLRQADKYGVAVPQLSSGTLPTYTSLSEACQAGADAEIADAALYDTLMAGTTRNDLLRVYSNLQSASLNNHLPQFEICQ